MPQRGIDNGFRYHDAVTTSAGAVPIIFRWSTNPSPRSRCSKEVAAMIGFPAGRLTHPHPWPIMAAPAPPSPGRPGGTLESLAHLTL